MSDSSMLDMLPPTAGLLNQKMHIETHHQRPRDIRDMSMDERFAQIPSLQGS